MRPDDRAWTSCRRQFGESRRNIRDSFGAPSTCRHSFVDVDQFWSPAVSFIDQFLCQLFQKAGPFYKILSYFSCKTGPAFFRTVDEKWGRWKWDLILAMKFEKWFDHFLSTFSFVDFSSFHFLLFFFDGFCNPLLRSIDNLAQNIITQPIKEIKWRRSFAIPGRLMFEKPG